MTRLLLALESTCDETAAAVVDEHGRARSSVVASQHELHDLYGGVVPEIAARAHLERMLPVIDQALRQADVRLADLHAVAVTTTPGLAGALVVGLAAAKALALALELPLVGVNHLHAHLYACQLGRPEPVFPCLGFVISGGHTSLFDCPDPATYTLLGGTIDDAAGEAFDKAAQLLGLPYPGGPSIARAARSGSATAHRFPRSFADDPRRLAFSFSGLKTALRYQIQPPGAEQPRLLTDAQRADLASSFQQAVVDALVAKALHALDHTRRDTLCVGGGVAANTLLRDTLAAALARRRTRTRLILAPPELCVDNAVMGALAWERLRLGQSDSLDIDITPGLVR